MTDDSTSTRVVLRAPRAWVEQTRGDAKAKGLSLSAYLRLLAVEAREAKATRTGR